MLLQRLVERSAALDSGIPPFYKDRAIRWQLNLTADGAPASHELVDLADPTDKARKNGTIRPAPYLTRTRAIAPCLGTDSLEYVLGWVDDPKRQDWGRDCTAAFTTLTQAWASHSTDPEAHAVAAFLNSAARNEITPPAGWASPQIVQLAVGGMPVADLPSARAFWAGEAERRKTGSRATAAAEAMCLVCGTYGPVLDTLPQQLAMRLVPLAKQNSALVSANKRIHTYDHTDGLASTAPICVSCGRQAVDALTDVLSDPHSHLRFADARMAWWTIHADPIDLAATLAVDDPETVASLVDRVRRSGSAPTTGLETGRFCALTVAGNVSRVMIRDWIDMPMASLERNVAAWFTDHQVDDPWGHHGYQPLWRLVLATGRSIKTKTSREYARLDDKSAARPDDVGRALLRAALLGKPLPSSLLAHLVTRIRTDGHLDATRAAVLRLALLRTPTRTGSPQTKETHPMPGLDPDNHDPAYLAGRIFAALENIQDATSGRAGTNTTFTDRYFAGAVANPRVAIVQGRQLAAAWLKKLRRTHPGLTVNLDRGLTGLFDQLDASGGLQGRIGITEQATFLLGYHHQRADTTRHRIANARTLDASSPLADSGIATAEDIDLPASATITEGTLA